MKHFNKNFWFPYKFTFYLSNNKDSQPLDEET